MEDAAAYPVIMRPWVRVLKDVAGAVAGAAALVAIMLVNDALDDRRRTRTRRRPIAKLPPDLTLEVYCAAMRADGGQDDESWQGRAWQDRPEDEEMVDEVRRRERDAGEE